MSAASFPRPASSRPPLLLLSGCCPVVLEKTATPGQCAPSRRGSPSSPAFPAATASLCRARLSGSTGPAHGAAGVCSLKPDPLLQEGPSLQGPNRHRPCPQRQGRSHCECVGASELAADIVSASGEPRFVLPCLLRLQHLTRWLLSFVSHQWQFG